jgi:phage terminase large subunit-like protein
MAKKLTRGQKVIAFIETFCRVPEGEHVGKAIILDPFQKKFILDVYDNPHVTRRAFLSIARKNGKTALIAGILLAHICGPEAVLNTQIISGALSRDQASVVFALACKMIQLNERLTTLVKIIPSSKKLIGLTRNVEYRALSADGRTAHGLSPVLAILDETGQVRGPQSDFIDAITTAQGAHKNPLLICISTQAPNDNDLLSIWLDDAKSSKDPRIVCHLYEADKDADIMDRDAWAKANPAMGKFRSLKDVEEQAERALRMPSFEPTFRNLVLNQRVEMSAPFISKGVWLLNSSAADESVFYEQPVYVGLDLSAKNDLTAMCIIANKENVWHVKPVFWTPEKGLRDRAKRDRAPYDIWAEQGFIRAISGASIDYEYVARDMADILDGMLVQAIAFDRWRFDLLRKELNELGLELPLIPFGQGFRDMAPAIDSLETILLNEQMAHSAHPVLTMCMANAKIEKDAAGNRKLNKQKTTGRIDGAVALAMAVGVTPQLLEEGDFDGFLSNPVALK